jgi:hypothetical protein
MNPINGAHTSFPLGKFQIADWEFNEASERDFVASFVSDVPGRRSITCGT